MTDDVDVDVDVEQLAVVSASGALRALLAEADPGLLSGAACLQVAEVLARTEKAFAAARMRFSARATDCGAHGSLGFASGEEWAARLTGASVGQARDELALAGKLAACPSTSAALAAGELSLAQAAEIARTEKALPGTEDAMVGLAGTLSLGALRDEGRKRRLAALDPGEAYGRQHRERSFRSWTDAAGMTRFRGALTPDKGVPFLSRLGAVCDRLQREARRAGSTESREAHAADALVALLHGDCDCATWSGSAGVPSQSSAQAQSSAGSAGSARVPRQSSAQVQVQSSAASGSAGDGSGEAWTQSLCPDQAQDADTGEVHDGFAPDVHGAADAPGDAPVPAQAHRPSQASAGGPAGGQPAGGGLARKPKRSPSVELVLLWDVAAARRGHTHHGEMCSILGAGPTSDAVARGLANDAFVKLVTHDGVKIDTVKHLGRHVRAELRTALNLGRPPDFEGVVCRELGCGRRYGLEWDHVDPVANGGPTSQDNLQPLCWDHHQDKTERDRADGRLGPFGVRPARKARATSMAAEP